MHIKTGTTKEICVGYYGTNKVPSQVHNEVAFAGFEALLSWYFDFARSHEFCPVIMIWKTK